jgi:hypothetical protein
MKSQTSVDFELCMKACGKSGRVLYAFSEFYLYFYGIAPTVLFEYFPVFGCISVAVYCVDESLEQEPGRTKGIDVKDLEQLVAKRIDVNHHINDLFRDAREYCSFEQVARAGRAEYAVEAVQRISEIRSVDFRLMHHALLQILRIAYDEEVFEWFRAFEVLMEIEDDLASVEEDELSGGYNYYCFTRNAGAEVGTRFETFRRSLENRLTTVGLQLSSRGYPRCAEVVERYRRLVPRRGVPDPN